jgi:hypothetical protein
LRTTAFPTLRLTVRPSRECPGSLPGQTRTTKAPDAARRPRRVTCWNSRGRSSRSVRAKRPVPPVTPTSTASWPRAASGPWRGVASGLRDRPASSCARGTHGRAGDGCDWAGTCAS